MSAPALYRSKPAPIVPIHRLPARFPCSSVSASFGIACFPTHALSKDDLIRQADAAMYRVKSTTKNAVGVASQSQERASRPASAT